MFAGRDRRPPEHNPFSRVEGLLIVAFFVVLAACTQIGWLGLWGD